MEQQRLFAWSETAGLLDHLDSGKEPKARKTMDASTQSNASGLHRSTVLDLLLEIKLLFEEFEMQQKRYKRLHSQTSNSPEGSSIAAADEPDNLVPVAPKRQKFLTQPWICTKRRTTCKSDSDGPHLTKKLTRTSSEVLDAE